MKVYVLTEGCYSDYHIVGVTLSKEKAEEYKETVSNSGWYGGVNEIEEYDTDALDSIPKGYRLYVARKAEGRDEINVFKVDPSEADEIKKPIIEKLWHCKEFRVYLYARDEEHATKVASEIYAEFIYNNPDAWKK